MFNVSLDKIEENDLQALIDSQIESEKAERKTLEYKQVLPAGNDDSKKEFLADVSSFANASGGNLLFGIEAQAGIPTKLTGIELDNVDAEKLRLEEIIRNGIEPRLPYVDIQPVSLSSKPNSYVLILRIQKSWLSPHRVKFKDHGHFYSRNSGGKYRLDTTELRTAFELSGSITDYVHRFRTERLSRIMVCSELPVILDESIPKLVLHMIPLSAFNNQTFVDIKIFRDLSKQNLMRPLVCWEQTPPTRPCFNLDGFARSAQWRRHTDSPILEPAGYVQVFRNGTIEIVDVTVLGIHGDEKRFLGEIFEIRLLQAVKQHIELQQSLGIEPPIFVMVSLLGVKGYKIDHGAHPPRCTEEIDRVNLIMPEVMIDSFDGDNNYIMKTMIPILDMVWNAAKYSSSPNYDEYGRYFISWN